MKQHTIFSTVNFFYCKSNRCKTCTLVQSNSVIQITVFSEGIYLIGFRKTIYIQRVNTSSSEVTKPLLCNCKICYHAGQRGNWTLDSVLRKHVLYSTELQAPLIAGDSHRNLLFLFSTKSYSLVKLDASTALLEMILPTLINYIDHWHTNVMELHSCPIIL